MFNNIIEKDYKKIQNDFSKKQSFCIQQALLKNRLKENYDNSKYTEKELVKRLQYLQNGINLYQSFFMSIFISAVFFALSLFLPSLIQITSESEREVAQHEYLLESNKFYANGYSKRLIDLGIENLGSINFDDWDKSEEKMFWDGYNFAQNNGYGYFFFSYKQLVFIIIFYIAGAFCVYYRLKLQQATFNKYQTNDFEIDLIKMKLGIDKKDFKHYRVKLKNQGRKVKVILTRLK